MRAVRHCIYALGLRPKAGSIWYSPSIDYCLKATAAMNAMEEVIKNQSYSSAEVIKFEEVMKE